MNEDMAYKIGYIDDRFPFDLTKSLVHNLKIVRLMLRDSGESEEEIEKYITETKSKYFNADGTRIDGKDK